MAFIKHFSQNYWKHVFGLFSLFLIAGCQTTPVAEAPTFFAEYKISDIVLNFDSAREPIHDSKIEAATNKDRISGSTLTNIGNRLTGQHASNKRIALLEGIENHVRPHVGDALTPLFYGTRPARAEVMIESVFVRSGAKNFLLDGTTVIVNGVQAPESNQFIAGLVIFDQETNVPLQFIRPLKMEDKTGSITFGQAKAPSYGVSGRLNKMAYEWSLAMADAVKSGRDDPLFGGPGGLSLRQASDLF